MQAWEVVMDAWITMKHCANYDALMDFVIIF